MISFRLTADEYTEAVSRCEQNGYRSVSTLARTATLGVVPTFEANDARLNRELVEVRIKMSEMRKDLDLILTMFAGKSEPVHVNTFCDDLNATPNMN